MRGLAIERSAPTVVGRRVAVKAWLPFVLAIAAGFPTLAEVGEKPSPAVRFYVAENGHDQWSGGTPEPDTNRTDGPWRSLAPLADAVENCLHENPAAAIEVIVRPGRYELSSPVVLKFSQRKGNRLVIRGEQPLTALISGGRRIMKWVPATAVNDLPSQLPAESRPHVFVAELRDSGIGDYGSPGGGGIELYYQDAPMTLARWPNEGFVKIVDVLNEQPFTTHGIAGDKVGKVHLRRIAAGPLAIRKGSLGSRVLVLGLVGPAPRNTVGRSRKAYHYREASLSQLWLPEGPVVLRI
jgi:hypothetical protein